MKETYSKVVFKIFLKLLLALVLFLFLASGLIYNSYQNPNLNELHVFIKTLTLDWGKDE